MLIVHNAQDKPHDKESLAPNVDGARLRNLELEYNLNVVKKRPKKRVIQTRWNWCVFV